MKISFKKIMCLVLVAVMFVTGTTSVYAARAKKYISDLKISYDHDGEKSKQALIDQGYTVIEKDLNEKADDLLSKSRVVYLGYKITQNPEEAITDVAMMSEQNGYSISDYNEILKDQYPEYIVLAEKEMVLVKAFRESYKNGNPFAIASYESLNNFMEDDSGKLLGDFLLDENLTMEDLFKLVTQVTGLSLSAYNQLLTAGIAEYGEDNFMTRLSALTDEEIKAIQGNNAYHDDAMVLYEQLELFRTQILKAESFSNIIDEMSEEELKAKESDEAWQGQMLENVDGMYIRLLINTIGYGDGNDSLCALLMKDNLKVNELYPLVNVMTPGQIASISFLGFAPVFKSVEVGTKEEINNMKAEIDKENKEKPKVVSAYYGVDRTIFTEEIGVTSKATRQMNATGDRSALTGNTLTPKAIDLIIGVGVSAGIGLAAAGSALACGKIALNYAANVKYTYTITMGGTIADAAAAASAMKAAVPVSRFFNPVSCVKAFKTQGGISTNTFSRAAFGGLVSNIVMYASIIATIITTYLLIEEIIDIYNPKYTKVPKIMLDKIESKDGNGETTYVRYNVVNGQDDEPGDLNGFAGKRWNALYVTKDPTAGKPLETMPLVDNTNKTLTGKAYLGVHEFGTTTAVNLNNFVFSGSATPTYLYFTQDINYKPDTTASVFSSTLSPLITAVAGAFIGFGGCFLIMRKRKVEKAPTQQNTIG